MGEFFILKFWKGEMWDWEHPGGHFCPEVTPPCPPWGVPGVFPPYLDGGAAVGDREAEHDKGLGHVDRLTPRLAAGQPHAVQVVRRGHHSPWDHQHKVSLQQALHGGCDTTERLRHPRAPSPGTGEGFWDVPLDILPVFP